MCDRISTVQLLSDVLKAESLSETEVLVGTENLGSRRMGIILLNVHRGEKACYGWGQGGKGTKD